MATCDKCLKRDAVASGIVSGTYYRNICQSCLNESMAISSGHARWERTVDMEDNEANVQQPYNADGSINVRFAKMYPKQAQALFTPEEIAKADRK